MTDALIRAEGLALAYGRNQVLSGVDLEVKPGEIVTLIGPNGAGKSTLVKVLLGLIRPDRGRVARKEHLQIGYLPQKFLLEPILPLSVARFMTLTARHSKEAVEESLEETGAGLLIDAPVHALSGGELQRVLLARAILGRPDLLVLDEPVQGVDFTGEAALYDLIGRIRRTRGCGVLMISHDLHLVMGATDRVICLNQHVCCAGAPHAVSRHPEYLKLFGLPEGDSFAAYVHHHDHRHDADGHVIKGASPSAAGDASTGDGSPCKGCVHDH